MARLVVQLLYHCMGDRNCLFGQHGRGWAAWAWLGGMGLMGWHAARWLMMAAHDGFVTTSIDQHAHTCVVCM